MAPVTMARFLGEMAGVSRKMAGDSGEMKWLQEG